MISVLRRGYIVKLFLHCRRRAMVMSCDFFNDGRSTKVLNCFPDFSDVRLNFLTQMRNGTMHVAGYITAPPLVVVL